MQLRSARLCLDCEELHEGQQCPNCASEAFAYLSRWISVDERRRRQRPLPPKPEESSATSKWLKRGAMGLAVVTAGRLLWETTRASDSTEPATRKTDVLPPELPPEE
jgi:hypothetical protein